MAPARASPFYGRNKLHSRFHIAFLFNMNYIIGKVKNRIMHKDEPNELTMTDDPFDNVLLRGAMYYGYEILKEVRPALTSRFHARFKGLTYYFRDLNAAAAAMAIPDETEYLKIGLNGGALSNRVLPAVIDALFIEFLNLHHYDNTLEIKERFCDQALAGFIDKYFPELDRRGAGYKRLQRICRELKEETDFLRHADGSNIRLSDMKREPGHFHKSKSPLFNRLLGEIARAARSEAPVLLTGESGVGKEVIARRIHALSFRSSGPFAPLNCGAVPENLLESELFGYKKGAFSGALHDKPGLTTQAEGGTLFLDEIGDISTSIQVKLLRFLQDHCVTPLGAVKPSRVNVRIVAATNSDLEKARGEGKFRQDLYYRLNVFRFEIPALRTRKEDIDLLAEHFIDLYNKKNRTRAIGLSETVRRCLKAYQWPGNIRELENTIQRAVILAGEGLIREEHLPPEITGGRSIEGHVEASAKNNFNRLKKMAADALALPAGPRGNKRRLGKSVPLDQIVRFFDETSGRPFPPRDFAEFITPPGEVRRDKLARQLLSAMSDKGLLKHNGRSSQAARYTLVQDSPVSLEDRKRNIRF